MSERNFELTHLPDQYKAIYRKSSLISNCASSWKAASLVFQCFIQKMLKIHRLPRLLTLCLGAILKDS